MSGKLKLRVVSQERRIPPPLPLVPVPKLPLLIPLPEPEVTLTPIPPMPVTKSTLSLTFPPIPQPSRLKTPKPVNTSQSPEASDSPPIPQPARLKTPKPVDTSQSPESSDSPPIPQPTRLKKPKPVDISLKLSPESLDSPLIPAPITSDIPDYEEALGCIYKVTCTVTSKSYIGQAKLVKYKNDKPYRYGAKGRWSDHVSSALQGDRTYLIFEAIREHGKDSFKITILEIVGLLNLDAKETEYIHIYDTLDPRGYNMVEHDHVRHTEERVRIVTDKYGSRILAPLDPSLLEEIKQRLQLGLDDKYCKRLQQLAGKEVTRIRIATAKSKSAPGQNIPYTAVIVFVMTSDMRLAREAIPFRFGGVHISVREAHDDAFAFAQRISRDDNCEFLDQVHLKSTDV